MTREKKKFKAGYSAMLLVLVAAIGAGLWMGRRQDHPVETPSLPAVSSSNSTAKGTATPTTMGDSGKTMVAPPAPELPQAPPPLPKEDEDRLHLWLTESETPADAASSILANWKQLSDPGRTAAAQHLANLVADDQFAPVANILLDPQSSQEVKSILFADILNRPDALKWPLIMKVLETKDHPLSPEARNILTVVLGRDYGDDWAKWQQHVDKDLLKKGEEQP